MSPESGPSTPSGGRDGGDRDGRTALTVVITATRVESELASDALWQLGAAAVQETERHDGRVDLRAALGEDRVDLTRRLADCRYPWRFEEMDLSVAETWRRFVSIIDVSPGLRVVPAWLEDSTSDATADDISLRIEPGPTFGLGTHATTRLCLRALQSRVVEGDRVLDVGTGTGILAIASVRLGAHRAVAIDINPASPAVVKANAAANGVAELVDASLEPLSSIHDSFDVVVANILAPVIRELSADIVRLARRCIVLSGLLAARYNEVLATMAPWRVREVLEEEGWAAVILER